MLVYKRENRRMLINFVVWAIVCCCICMETAKAEEMAIVLRPKPTGAIQMYLNQLDETKKKNERSLNKAGKMNNQINSLKTMLIEANKRIKGLKAQLARMSKAN